MNSKIELLHPDLRDICYEFLAKCEAEGLMAAVAETWRSKEEQDALYEQGRTKPGEIITNAQYPDSGHCWGVAFDIYRNDGMGAYYDADGWFTKCGQIGKSMGLFWGGDFHSLVDKPHYEYPRFMPANSCDYLIAAYGEPEVFKETWEETMTKEQFAKMMNEYLTDREAWPPSIWATELVESAVANGFTDGSAPRGLATREEVMAMIIRVLGDMQP